MFYQILRKVVTKLSSTFLKSQTQVTDTAWRGSFHSPTESWRERPRRVIDVSRDDRQHRHAVHVYVNDSFIELHRLLRGSRESRAKTRARRGALINCSILPVCATPSTSGTNFETRAYNLSSTSRGSRPFSRRLLRTSGKLRCGSYSLFPYVLSGAAAT